MNCQAFRRRCRNYCNGWLPNAPSCHRSRLPGNYHAPRAKQSRDDVLILSKDSSFYTTKRPGKRLDFEKERRLNRTENHRMELHYTDSNRGPSSVDSEAGNSRRAGVIRVLQVARLCRLSVVSLSFFCRLRRLSAVSLQSFCPVSLPSLCPVSLPRLSAPSLCPVSLPRLSAVSLPSLCRLSAVFFVGTPFWLVKGNQGQLRYFVGVQPKKVRALQVFLPTSQKHWFCS